MPAPKPLILALLCAVAAMAGGCGDDEEDVRDTLSRYAKAVEQKDYQELCDELLAKQLLDNLQTVGLPCELALQRGFADVQKPSITVRNVKIDGDEATAVARTDAANQEPSEDTIRLVKEDGDWKIFALSTVES